MAFFPSRTALSFASRDRRTLLRGALAIGGASLLVAVAIDLTLDKDAEGGEEVVDRSSPEVAAEFVKMVGRQLAARGPDDVAGPGVEEISQEVAGWTWLGDEVRGTFLDFISACGSPGGEGEAGRRSLLQRCGQDPPHDFAHLFAAELASISGRQDEALSLLESGFAKTGDGRLLRRGVELALQWGEDAFLARALGDPGRRLLLTPRLRTQVALELRDYGELFRSSMLYEWAGLSLPLVLLSALSVFVWFAVLMQLFAGWRWWLPMLAALALGMASAFLTLYMSYVQEHIRGFTFNGDFAHDLLVCIAGIGLREEMVKLLCFFPLLPWALWRGGRDGAIAAAACVGLGFALQENAGYYEAGASVAWGRFLTATFLHMSMTGIAGHAVYWLARDPRRHWENSITDLLAVVVAHGIYDAFLTIEQLGEYAIATLFVVAYLAYRFFGLVQEARGLRRTALSPLCVFVLGGAILLGVTLNFSLWEVPFRYGIAGFGLEVVPIFPVVFLFVNYFRDT